MLVSTHKILCLKSKIVLRLKIITRACLLQFKIVMCVCVSVYVCARARGKLNYLQNICVARARHQTQQGNTSQTTHHRQHTTTDHRPQSTHSNTTHTLSSFLTFIFTAEIANQHTLILQHIRILQRTLNPLAVFFSFQQLSGTQLLQAHTHS